MKSTDKFEAIETLQTVPALIFSLEHPKRVDEYAANPDEPIPVIVAPPAGKSLNSLLPPNSEIYLCQNDTAVLVMNIDLRFRGTSLLFPNENIALRMDSINERADFIGFDEGDLEGIGKLLFDVGLVRRGLRRYYQNARGTVLRNHDTYWGEHKDDRDQHGLLDRRLAIEYVEAIDVYTGIYSTAVAEALDIAKQLDFVASKKRPLYPELTDQLSTTKDSAEVDLYDRLNAYYNAKLTETYQTVVANLANFHALAQAPNADGTVIFFNPRLGKYVRAPWKFDVLVEISEGKYEPPIDTAWPKTQGDIEEITQLDDDRTIRQLTRLYETHFPEKPLELIIEHTGRIISLDSLEVLEGSEVLVKTADGLTVLNDFLPSGQTILSAVSPNCPCFYVRNKKLSGSHVVIDFDHFYNNDTPDEKLAITIAHEIGHAFNPPRENYIDLEAFGATLEDASVSFNIDGAVEKLGQIAQRMEDEADAWNKGKLIATACGIDDTTYEMDQEISLATYFHSGLDLILRVLEHCHELIDSDEIEMYNPYIQEYRVMTVAEIRKFVRSIEFQSKARTAFSTANNIHGL